MKNGSHRVMIKTGLLFTFLLFLVLWPSKVLPCPPAEAEATGQIYLVPCDGTVIHLIVVSPTSFSSSLALSALLPLLACFGPAWSLLARFHPCQRMVEETRPRIPIPPPRFSLPA